MKLNSFYSVFVALLMMVPSFGIAQSDEDNGKSNEAARKSIESNFITNARQLTFEGRRAGEGYFSPDGSLMVFQSERVESNPYFQIFLLDMETGDVESVSPGHGKTTCAWVHSDNNRVLYASTQDDPQARAKQKEELEFRESGQARRYSWDYDETYDLIEFDRTTKKYKHLTNERGYDAEGSYSPDGKLIAFASNRRGYSDDLTEEQKKAFEQDPAYMMEIYIMNSDGTNVRQLTDVPGYDGGPFFSPDGKRICWRRFASNGATAEIMTMNIDGTDQKTLTNMRALSWAPFYHPTGEYLIFTTNKHGFANFELYLVDADGKSPPVRVTDTDGFDGLASFTPDGKQLTWTSNRNAKKESQIYLANWNHDEAKKRLAVKPGNDDADVKGALEKGTLTASETAPSFDARDVMRHVDYLCRKELGGRMTGTIGERKATAYVAAYLDHLGFKPAGDNGTWFQEFEFPNGAKLGEKNQFGFRVLDSGQSNAGFEVDKDWRPLSFSGNKTIENAGVVFAGYGIVAPAAEGQEEYDSYVHLDVKDKWVVVFRYVPEGVSPKRRQHLQFYASLRKKAFHARENGAAGMIVVSGPNSQVRKQLVPMQNDFSPSGSSVAALSITDDLARQMFKAAGKNMADLQTKLDDGSPMMGFDLKGIEVTATVDIEKLVGKGRNVLGRMLAGDQFSEQAVLVGAHIDHLGAGRTGGSLARDEERGAIHVGADDNASGVAAMLEVAEYLADQKRNGKLKLKRDVIFAGWSGEELGLHGSQHYVESVQAELGLDGKSKGPKGGKETAQESKSDNPNPNAPQDSLHSYVIHVQPDGGITVNGNPQTLEGLTPDLKFIGKSAPNFVITITSNKETELVDVTDVVDLCKTHGVKTLVKEAGGQVAEKKTSQAGPNQVAGSINQRLAAALNMDMVGRMQDRVVLQGISSSPYWKKAIESKNAIIGLPVTLSDDTDLPTDASSFYRAGVPILSAFTGNHTDYHTPRDTPDKLNYPEAARIAKLMGLITRSLATAEDVPKYIKQESKPKQEVRGGLRAYLGTVPSYGDDVVGVMLSDASKGGPAEKAGVLGGDIIVELAGRKIENIYDYTAVIDALKIGQETTIVVEREGKRVEMKITPSSRQ